MLRPNIEDVIEYVKAGEDDPVMGRMLRRDPDGQELLKQARFICKVLEHRFETVDDSGMAASFDMATSMEVESRSKPSVRMMMELRSEAPPRPRKPRSVGALLDRFGRGAEDLGTLEFAEEDDSIVVSYEPSDVVQRRYGKTSDAFELAQANILGIEIRGLDFNLSLPNSLQVGRPAILRITRGPKRLPVKRLGLTFMPESGPFARLNASVKGIAELPVPDQSGTLLIAAGDRAQLLHIKIKK